MEDWQEAASCGEAEGSSAKGPLEDWQETGTGSLDSCAGRPAQGEIDLIDPFFE